MKTAIAIGAHPDDIELMMAGTLLQLKNHGYEIHYMNLSVGNVGSVRYDGETLSALRLQESMNAAAILGARHHAPFCRDMEIFYDDKSLRQLAALIREVKPSVILTHSPSDYMEDHMNTCRLTVSAAFTRGMPNYETTPPLPAGDYDCTIYHALPHTLSDQLRRPIKPGAYVNTTPVHDIKMAALKAHQSQQSWLDVSQKMNSYLQTMDDISRAVGRMSKQFEHAEGWRRHSHFGFGGPDTDPLKDLGASYIINQDYENELL